MQFSLNDGKIKDAGWISAGILFCTLFVGLVLSSVVFSLARGGFLRDTAQHGADAAALAGAQEVADEYYEIMSEPFLSTRDLHSKIRPARCSALGSMHADQLARANEAVVGQYCWNGYTGEIHVSTRSGSAELSAKEDAVAGFHINPYDCEIMVEPGLRWPGEASSPDLPHGGLVDLPPGFRPYLDCEGHKVKLLYGLHAESMEPGFVVEDTKSLELLLEEKLVR